MQGLREKALFFYKDFLVETQSDQAFVEHIG
jgi:hypothetical protein